ncbi:MULTISPECIES: ATP-binding protein [unclassified Pedobacter]|uniref:sensor histidine kinase n=1 Tax=unclassified Pedobacter TaxID=2628915 RepID=UPI001D3FAF4D|nr:MULTISPECIES: ATP-binding protein [unclassified Pedobacter]CAH0279828.1 Alkaline phosphatase synthesis sensor protein PhoR [Pedobacter sp. Bi126]CAH0306835.1 Alkaline phosphatase synthesis sensor protein PhoR [Pedobacter sp. Bi36]
MKIKTKLRLGFGFLFILVLSFGLIALFFLNELSDKSKAILKDNYKSLKYVAAMRNVIDQNQFPLSSTQLAVFKENLKNEGLNITEPGEKVAFQKLETAFAMLNGPQSLSIKENSIKNLRVALQNIEQVNMKAIYDKNELANETSSRANLYIMIAATLSFIILFTFIVNFPGFVANPLAEFGAAIKQISRKNYKQRLHFENEDEFTELADSFNGMVVKLNEWENSNLSKIKSEKSRIEAIIAQMQDAIIGLNEKGEVLFLNHLAAKLMSLDEDKVIGQNVAELMQKNELLKRIIKPETNDNTLKIYADDKESYFLLENREIIIPNYEEQDENTLIASSKSAGSVYTLKNITQFKELDEAKTNFIATVSHELKTPLSSIKMSLKLLNDERVGAMNEEQHELLNHIKEDSDRLLKITSELLDLSQVETGNLKLTFAITKPEEIVSYAVDAVKFQAEQKSIQLVLNCNQNLRDVNADIQKTAWVLVNFLSNALRYSAEKSKVIIDVFQKDKFIEFSVRDFGKGIDEKYQKRLFDRYFQVPTDGQNKSGSGLGLAISKDFIEAENGKIWVVSAIGEGSKFCFSLPIVE